MSQQDRYTGDNNTSSGKQRHTNYHNRRSHNWTFARLIIPDLNAAHALLAETKTRPITSHGRKLKFVPDNSKRKIPFDVVNRLLSVPFGGKRAVIREQTAQSLRRGIGLHLFQLGTINRDGDFASEHTVYDAAKVPMTSPPTPHPPARQDEGQQPPHKPMRPTGFPSSRCIIGCEGGFKGMYIRIIKPDKILTFRMAIRTIEQICWSPSSSPAPPEAFRPRPPRRQPPRSTTTLNKLKDEEDINEDYLEPQEVIIRLSQPFILEQSNRETGKRLRLSELSSKPHISPYCFTCIYISGYNLVETLESMAKIFNSPFPWELQIQKSNWRRYTSAALKKVEEKIKDMPLPFAFQYQVSSLFLLQL